MRWRCRPPRPPERTSRQYTPPGTHAPVVTTSLFDGKRGGRRVAVRTRFVEEGVQFDPRGVACGAAGRMLDLAFDRGEAVGRADDGCGHPAEDGVEQAECGLGDEQRPRVPQGLPDHVRDPHV